MENGSDIAQRGLRLIILLYRNLGRGGTKAVVQALPGDAVKVDLEVARPWSFKVRTQLSC